MGAVNIDIKYVPGVGAKRAELLGKELGVGCADDLLEVFPYKYVDRSRIHRIGEISGEPAYMQLRGTFSNIQIVGQGSGKRRLTAVLSDGTGAIEVVWFQAIEYNQSLIARPGAFMVFGKPSVFGNKLSLVHPEVEPEQKANLNAGTLQPFYNTTDRMKKAGLNSQGLHKIIGALIDRLDSPLPETLPANFCAAHHLMQRDRAIRAIHRPKDFKEIEEARFRLKFEELFYIQLGLLRQRNLNRKNIAGVKFSQTGGLLSQLYKDRLTFEPTDAQKRVVHEIWGDMKSGRQMNRLLQGDVGSGKTLVALMVMLLCAGNGRQACLMAPTEILAQQHLASLTATLGDMPVRVELLTGSTRKKERDRILAALAAGEADILVGTHALIEDPVVFKDLALAVIDEQHRFGVQQRAKLWAKAATPPHVLVMTATPIPRTLAMTLYGDLDVSVIDQMPPGRKPVVTEHYFHNHRNALNRFLREQIAQGRQIYVVYPLIEESEKADFKNLTDGFEYMKEAFPECRVCMVHGKLKPQEKEEMMGLFVRGEAQIMVATTVIEVGVNVPNASVMVIESAERFGLSQLHQLRGRVGRGADQSYCLLMTDFKLSRESRQRMEIMVESTDGFRIAEADLQLRGPGNIEGTEQSGLPFALKVADLARDASLVQHTREAALAVLADDPTLQKPENGIMARRLAALRDQTADWSKIS